MESVSKQDSQIGIELLEISDIPEHSVECESPSTNNGYTYEDNVLPFCRVFYMFGFKFEGTISTVEEHYQRRRRCNAIAMKMYNCMVVF